MPETLLAIKQAVDFAGLRRLRRVAGRRFRMGVLLYDGDHTTAFGEGLFAVPVGALWGGGEATPQML